MLSTVILTLILVLHVQHAASTEEELLVTGQCVSHDEMESLRYRLYCELTDSKKEIELLKKNIIRNRLSIHCDLNTIREVLTSCQPNKATEGIIDEVRAVLEDYKRTQSREMREIVSGMSCDLPPLGTFLNPAPSCKEVPENNSSGNYWIQNTGTGYASLEYCDMSRRCCNSTGGWMRVAHLDMTDPTQQCPTEFMEITSPNRTCRRPGGGGCISTTYPVNGVSYSRVCGRIDAYQYSSTDAFRPYFNNRALTIDDTYVDGVSLTHGQNPRDHIWTFAAAADEVRSDGSACPCTKTDSPYTGVVPPFIGNDYFCDTGSRSTYANQFYSEDPLWDGAGCGDSSTCCQFNNPPWFCKQLPQPTTEDIELRLCADEHSVNEDTAIQFVELYVQ